MLAQAHGKASDSPRYSQQPDFALESSGNANRPDSTFVPVTTSSSRHPSLSLPAQDLFLPAPGLQTSHDFTLPVRGRHEPQVENRRGTVAAFGNFFGAASHLATPESSSWYSQEGYQQAVTQFQARRSRSQPPRPGPGTSYSQQQQQEQQQQQQQQQPFKAPVSMSAFAPILPSPSSHFGPSNEFFSSVYSPNLGFDGSMIALPDQLYFGGVQEQRSYTISPPLLPSTQSYGTSTPRTSSKPVSRSPPLRERTPIRHHRPSVSRARSGSRPDVLLAYAEQHQHQHQHQQQHQHQHQHQQQAAPAVHMQSTPNTPPVYPQSAYSLPTTAAAPPSHSGYYATPSLPHSAAQYLTTPSPFASDPNQTSYFTLTRSVSQPTLELGTLNPQDAMYLPNPSSIPSNSPSLPSLGSNLHSFPPPASSLESSPEGFRVLASRPKPQCFDHGCNGRQFSTFSNLLRHQREKSGSAMKAVCPHCGTEFTRTTARNGHLWGGKCKGRSGDGLAEEGQSEKALSPTGSE